MHSFLSLSIALLLILHSAIAHAAAPSLTVSTTQHGATAQLTIGSFDAPPTALQVTLPSGWSGAPATVVMSGTQLLTFDLVRGVGAPQLGVVRVEGGGMTGHAYLAGPVLESPKPAALYRRWLPIARR